MHHAGRMSTAPPCLWHDGTWASWPCSHQEAVRDFAQAWPGWFSVHWHTFLAKRQVVNHKYGPVKSSTLQTWVTWHLSPLLHQKCPGATGKVLMWCFLGIMRRPPNLQCVIATLQRTAASDAGCALIISSSHIISHLSLTDQSHEAEVHDPEVVEGLEGAHEGGTELCHSACCSHSTCDSALDSRFSEP